MVELNIIQTRLKAPKNQYNSFGGYSYRNAEDILEAVKPLLAENKCTLTLTDEVVLIGDRYYVRAVATLTSEAGQSVSVTAFAREEESKKGMDGSQITGAASSYARKYALAGLFCLDDNKDADYARPTEQTTAPAEEKKAVKSKAKPKAEAPAPEQPATDQQCLVADTLEKAVELAANAGDAKTLTAVWNANKEQFGLIPDFVMAISKNPNNPKKR